MFDFFSTLKFRNEALFTFGLICIIGAVICIAVSFFSHSEVRGANAWFKPFKFFLSIALYSWAMAWFNFYLPPSRGLTVFNWVVIIGLGFEVVYITLQAWRGQESHFNVSSVFYGVMYSLMGLAATVVTLYTAYIGYKFFQVDLSHLPDYYVWSIRFSIILFVIFAFEGFIMGRALSHTVGGPDGGPGLPLLGWSYQYGDPRIAHFIGMHALQVLPLLSFYLLKGVHLTFVVAIIYTAVAVLVLVQALQGKPIYKVPV